MDSSLLKITVSGKASSSAQNLKILVGMLVIPGDADESRPVKQPRISDEAMLILDPVSIRLHIKFSKFILG